MGLPLLIGEALCSLSIITIRQTEELVSASTVSRLSATRLTAVRVKQNYVRVRSAKSLLSSFAALGWKSHHHKTHPYISVQQTLQKTSENVTGAFIAKDGYTHSPKSLSSKNIRNGKAIPGDRNASSRSKITFLNDQNRSGMTLQVSTKYYVLIDRYRSSRRFKLFEATAASDSHKGLRFVQFQVHLHGRMIRRLERNQRRMAELQKVPQNANKRQRMLSHKDKGGLRLQFRRIYNRTTQALMNSSAVVSSQITKLLFSRPPIMAAPLQDDDTTAQHSRPFPPNTVVARVSRTDLRSSSALTNRVCVTNVK